MGTFSACQFYSSPCPTKFENSLKFLSNSSATGIRSFFLSSLFTPLLTVIQFLTRCTKPSQKGLLLLICTVDVSLIVSPEFLQICKAVLVGFAVMGFIGYFVKLIHIPMCVTQFSI